MKQWISFFLIAAVLSGCGGESTPDVSNISVTTIVRRFDRDFFALDTSNLEPGLNALNNEYPDFFQEYLVKVLGINPADPQAPGAIRAFLASYRPVFTEADAMADRNLPTTQKQLEQALKLMRHYAPEWKIDSPFVITSFIGPMDAFEPFPLGDYGDVRTAHGVGIALQLHLGKDAEIYTGGREAGIFYDYQTRRFTPETMVVNSMKNVIADAFPYRAEGLTLVAEMIEKGKRMYLLDKVLPETPDSLKLGYTAAQTKGSFANEALIWAYFVQNDLLYSKDVAINQNYIKDGPKTTELGEAAPGYIGLFVGRQIVRAFMKKHEEMSIPELMKTPPATILEESKYKP